MSDNQAIEAGYPSPPGMHWAVLLVLSIVTLGVFGSIWAVYLAYWLRKIRPDSKALQLYVLAGLLAVAQLVFRFLVPMHNLSAWLGLFEVFFWIIASLNMEEDLSKHYNGDEPIGLSLGIWPTLFLSIYYFQYHLSGIARIKRRNPR